MPAAEGDPIAVDPRSRELLKLARRVAQSDVTVLISGESGTGKEVYARFLHSASRRRSGPFVAINCAAIPDNMLEAVLFGHEKGALTGATGAHAGKFEQAMNLYWQSQYDKARDRFSEVRDAFPGQPQSAQAWLPWK